MRRPGYLKRALLPMLVVLTALMAGGCEIEMFWEDEGDGLGRAIEQIANGIEELVDYFD